MARTATDSRRLRDRRRNHRYDICLNLRYVIQRRGNSPITGSGESINVSVSGLLFQAEAKAQAGDSVLAVMDWPTRGPKAEALMLVMSGFVLRNRKSETAVSLTTSRLLPAGDIDRRLRHYFLPTDEALPSTSDDAEPSVLGDDQQRRTDVVARLDPTIQGLPKELAYVVALNSPDAQQGCGQTVLNSQEPADDKARS